MNMNNHRFKEVVFADDFTIAEKIERIKSYWEMLHQVGLFPILWLFPKVV